MNKLLLLILLTALNTSGTSGFWGKTSLVNGICKNTATAMKVSKNFCSSKPELVKTVVDGITLAISECKHKFRNRKWNCSTLKKSIRKILQHDYRETAFVFAITSAGIAYEVSKACSTGRLEVCKCRESRIGGIEEKDHAYSYKRSVEETKLSLKEEDRKKFFQRNGCQDFVHYGYEIAKQFVERENNKDAKALVTRHNSEAGRLAVKNHMVKKCKCHGLSEICTMKSCWLVLAPFRETSERIKAHFDGASKVSVDNKGEKLLPLKELEGVKAPTSEDLVYTTTSPNFCERDKETGSLGTTGRRCNVTSEGTGGCKLLCCQRGYETKHYVEEFNCKCVFYWCCEVRCKICKRERVFHTCL